MLDYAFAPPPAKQYTLVQALPLDPSIREIFAVERMEAYVIAGVKPENFGRWTRFFQHCIFGPMFSGEQGEFSWVAERTGFGMRTRRLTFRSKHGGELVASIHRAQYEHETTVVKDGEVKRLIIKDWDMRFAVTTTDDRLPLMAILYADSIFG